MHYFILPAYNESGIGMTITNLEQFCLAQCIESRIILVDDGSNPKLESYLEKELENYANFTLIRLDENQGPGKAFGKAFQFLPKKLHSDDVVVTLEADGTSPLSILPEMLERLKSRTKSYELVLASPYVIGGSIENTSWLRRVMSYLANEIFRNLLDLRGIWTISSFYRVYSHLAINELREIYGDSIIVMDGFECMVEMLWKCKQIGLTICEIPSVVDCAIREGRSKMKVFKTIQGYLRLYFKVREFRKLEK